MTAFLWRAMNQQPLRVWGNGCVARDYFFVTDLAQACLKAALYKGENRIFNIGSGSALTINQVIAMISRVCIQTLDVIYESSRPFDVPEIVLDITRAREHLDWYPLVPFEQGVALTWQWLKTVQSKLRD